MKHRVHVELFTDTSQTNNNNRNLLRLNRSYFCSHVITLNIFGFSVNFKQLVNYTAPPIDGHVDMLMLYNETAHREEDFIRK